MVRREGEGVEKRENESLTQERKVRYEYNYQQCLAAVP